MSTVELTEILISARQEAHRMRHYYIGVEHLFIALLHIQSGLTQTIIEPLGLTPDYISDAIRRKTGKGSNRRLWSGTPSTPRANVVLDIANDLALEDGRSTVNERDLLIAILDEADNLPVRVLKALGVHLELLYQRAQSTPLKPRSAYPFVKIEFNPDFATPLNDEHLLVLRRMFSHYSLIRVQDQLVTIAPDAFMLVATPLAAGQTSGQAVVVKLDRPDAILDEVQRYERHTKNLLPATAARITGTPITLEIADSAGIGYTLPAEMPQPPTTLQQNYPQPDSYTLAAWLKERFYPSLSKTWWQPKQTVTFPVWKEYDWMLPPALIVRNQPDNTPDSTLRVPLGLGQLSDIVAGQVIALENFTVERINYANHTLHLINGQGTGTARAAHTMRITESNLRTVMYFRGEVVDRIVGQVEQTRADIFQQIIAQLDPPFEANCATFVLPTQPDQTLLNPTHTENDLSNHIVTGTLSPIHGGLHPQNILLDAEQNPVVVDFAHSREGHTLLDWAMLETSLLCRYSQPSSTDTWETAMDMLQALPDFKTPQPTSDTTYPAIAALRQLVAQLLARPGQWEEYCIALMYCALRCMTLESMYIGQRRLMFLLAATARTHITPPAPGTEK